MAKPELIKLYFYRNSRSEREHKPTQDELIEAIQNQKDSGEYAEVPDDWNNIYDYESMRTNKQFWWTKVHVVYAGGHTLDVWIDLNDCEEKCWMGYGPEPDCSRLDYEDLSSLMYHYRSELPDI